MICSLIGTRFSMRHTLSIFSVLIIRQLSSRLFIIIFPHSFSKSKILIHFSFPPMLLSFQLNDFTQRLVHFHSLNTQTYLFASYLNCFPQTCLPVLWRPFRRDFNTLDWPIPFLLRSEAFFRPFLSNNSSRHFGTWRRTRTPPCIRPSVSTSRTPRLHIVRMIRRHPPVGRPYEGPSVPPLPAFHFQLVDLPWEAPHGSV